MNDIQVIHAARAPDEVIELRRQIFVLKNQLERAEHDLEMVTRWYREERFKKEYLIKRLEVLIRKTSIRKIRAYILDIFEGIPKHD